MAVLNFNASEHEPFEQGATRFPLGDYPFIITQAVQKASKNNARSGLLEVTIKVTDGPYKGCTAKPNFNLWNENEQARNIANRQFSSLCHSIGRIHIADDQHIVGGTGVVVMGPQDDNDKYSEVKCWKDVNYRINGKGEPVRQEAGNAPAAPTPAAWGSPAAAVEAANAAAASAPSDTPPWAGAAAPAAAPAAPAGWSAPAPTAAPPAGPGPAPGGVPPWAAK